MEKLSQKEWLEYINRLQERERQKISSGGISNWVLFAAIGTLSYWLFPVIPNLRESFDKFILASALFNNLGIALFDFFNHEFRQHRINKLRLSDAPELERRCRRLIKVFELTYIILSLTVNMLAFHLSDNFHIILSVFIFRSLKGVIDVFNRIDSESLSSENNSDLITRMVSSIYLITAIYPFILIFYINRFSKEDLQIALYGLIFVLIMMIVQLLGIVFVKRLKIGWLEEFEREIISKDLTDYEIRKKLNENYHKLSHIDDYF